MEYEVKNCPSYEMNAKYTVIRECGDGFWYYGGWNDVTTAYKVAISLGNGLIVETENIKRI